MELQFYKNQCACLQRLKREVQNQEQTQEVRISDGMPDIGSVLGAWGQVLVRSKEWRSGAMSVSGGVMAWVLYAPEDGSDPQCMETWIPFQMRWDLPDTEQDGTIRVNCLLRGVDARSTSARKLMVRATVGILGEAYVPGQVDVYSPEALPEDVQVLKNTYPMRLPKEAGEKSFVLEEELTLPGTNPKPEKLIRYSLQPEMIDQKVMAGKVVFRGAAIVHILYKTEDGQICGWDFELPFSQYAELDREYDLDATARVQPAVTSLELDMDPEGRLLLKAGLVGQYVICDRNMVEVIEDAYSPRRTVKTRSEELQLPMILDEQQQTVHVEQNAPVEGTKVLDVSFCPDHARQMHNDGSVDITLQGQFQMLYYDMDGKLQSTAPRWEDTWNLPVGENAQVQTAVSVTGKPQGSVSPGGGELRADILMDMMTTTQQGIPMVTALEIGELTEPDPNRPSLILRKIGDDRLWDVAKRTGSTVEAIKEANHLTENPSAEQMLLIPVL